MYENPRGPTATLPPAADADEYQVSRLKYKNRKLMGKRLLNLSTLITMTIYFS